MFEKCRIFLLKPPTNLSSMPKEDVDAALNLIHLSGNVSAVHKANKMQSKPKVGAKRKQKRRNADDHTVLSLKPKRPRKAKLDPPCIDAHSVLEENELHLPPKKRKGMRKYNLWEPAGFLEWPTPDDHTAITFSITHFLSAVRAAFFRNYTADQSNPESSLPCLTLHEIVERVILNPGDPCVLESRVLLPDLVCGALDLVSSTKPPLGAKGWRALTVFTQSNNTWSWIGPVVPMFDSRIVESATKETWGLPSKTLLKLVHCFVDWLIIAQRSAQMN